MTIATIIIKSGPYTGNDSTVDFAYDFRILAQTELVVTKTTISTGAVVTLTLTTDYTVSGVGDASGGDVTTVATPTTDENIFIYRSSPLVQATDFLNQGAFFPEIHEDQFDKIINIIQELNDQLGRQPALDIDSVYSDLILPDPVAGYHLIWNAGLTGLENAISYTGAVTISSFIEAALDETTIADFLAALGTDAAWLSAMSARGQGKDTIWIPAASMQPTVSNGCATLTLVETTSGRPDIQVLDFDASSDEHAQFQVAFPKSWNLGTATYQAFWTSTATDTDGVAWGLQGVAVTNDGTIDVAYGTAVVVTDDNISAAEDLLVTSESSAVTIAGTPADDDMCFFRVFRDVSDANDDMTEDARLIGIKLFFTTDAATDT